MKKRVLSGIRATGRLHLGNYFGAVQGMLELQNNPEYETLYMVADLHTVTTPYTVEELRQNRREVFLEYLACGLDPEKSILFFQSDVAEHTELAFYFSSVATIARMSHLPTYKDKVKQYPHDNTMALLNYPILMAADILLYKAGLVPVGVDQEPHLEVAREVARKMNEKYGLQFPEPKRFMTKGEYIPSLKGEGKMSKSVEGSFINLMDSQEAILKKVRSIPTATTAGGEMSGGVKSLFALGELFLTDELAGFAEAYENGTLQFSTMKDALANAIFTVLQPIQLRYNNLVQDEKQVDAIIQSGAEKARQIARTTVAEVKTAMGLRS